MVHKLSVSMFHRTAEIIKSYVHLHERETVWMKDYISLLIEFAPELIISAVLSFYLNRYISRLNDKPFFYISKDRLPITEKINLLMTSKLAGLSGSSTPQSIGNQSSQFRSLVPDNDLREVSSTMLSVSSWFLLFLVIVGISKASLFFPFIPGLLGIMLYSIVVMTFSVALISTVGVKFLIGISRRKSAIVIAALIAIIFFFLPSTSWILSAPLNRIILYVLIYFSVFFVVVICYLMWWHVTPKRLFHMSVVSSFLVYFIIVAFSLFKLLLLIH